MILESADHRQPCRCLPDTNENILRIFTRFNYSSPVKVNIDGGASDCRKKKSLRYSWSVVARHRFRITGVMGVAVLKQ